MAMAGRAAAQKIIAKAGPNLSSAPLSTTASAHGAPSQRPSRMADAASLASMKKGGGFRSSFSGTVATVFGATGFLGRGVTNRLGKIGSQMIIPYHGEHYDSMRLKVCGDLGQVLFTPYNLKDEESIKTAMKHSNVVINLIGREYETMNFNFHEVNVAGPARLARLAREAGADRFVHMSHVNARENPQKCFMVNGSKWLRTKWQGEQAVLEEFPDATIIRSADIYGAEDHFIRYYMSVWRHGMFHVLPLWNKGEDTVKAPIHSTDVSQAIVNSLTNPAAKGTTYELQGPEQYLLSNLMDYAYSVCRRDVDFYNYKRTYLQMSPRVFAASIFGDLMPLGKMNMGFAGLDKLERTSLSEEFLGLPGIESLGVTPFKVEEKMPHNLLTYRSFAYHEPENKAEEVPVIPLKPLGREDVKMLREGAAGNPLLKAIGF